MKKLVYLLLLFSLSLTINAQRVYIEGTEFMREGCPIYFNGANTPWDNWNDFGGNYNPNFWETHFADMAALGLNSSRVWISCSGEVQPNISSDGTVTGVSQQFWSNVDHLVATAEANGIYLMPTMISFDHVKNTYTTYQRWRNMINNTDKVQSYIDNYLVPFVKRYNDNPYVYSIDICNEIEWMVEDGNIASYAILQNFVARCAAAIHENSDILVSMGTAGVKWNSDLYEANYWKDAALQAQYNDPDAFLDFYQLHYYDWQHPWYSSPFELSPEDYQINDRPVVVGEMPGKDMATPNMTMDEAFEAMLNLGYKGHYPWTSNNAGVGDFGSLATFGNAALAFKNEYANYVNSDCGVQCTAVALGPDQSLCGLNSIELSAGNIPATNKVFTWYKDGEKIAGSSTELTVNSAGTYKIEVDSASGLCVKSDEVIISDEIPQPDLGADKDICESSSVTLDAGVESESYTYIWEKDNATISAEESQTLVVSEAGTYSVTVLATGCESVKDEVWVSSSLLVANSDTLCEEGNAELSVSGGSGTYTWHATPESEEILSDLSTYNPYISASETFYVQDAGTISQTIGLSEPSGEIWNVNDFTTNDKKNLIEVSQSVILNAVYVYPSGPGTNVNVRILNGTTVVGEGSVEGAGTNRTRVELNINLEPGTYTIDAVGSSGPLRYTSDGAAFPYAVDGFISFKENASWSGTRYGMFYDWEISTGAACVRTPVHAVLDPASECTITNLMISNKKLIEVYPNPFEDNITITGEEISEIQIKDMIGNVVFSSKSKTETINLSMLVKGVYLIEIKTGNEKVVKKIVKQ